MSDSGLEQVDSRFGFKGRDFLANSVLFLILSNLIVIGWAIKEKWDIVFVLWLYWAQSLIIGIFWFLKITSHPDLFYIPFGSGINEHADFDIFQRLRTAFSFLFAYCFAHFIFIKLVYLGVFGRLTGEFPVREFTVICVVFVINQIFTYAEDLHIPQRPVSFASFVALPFLRVIPMFGIIVVGVSLQEYNPDGQDVLILFLLLKTVADVVMHVVQKNFFAERIEKSVEDIRAVVRAAELSNKLILPDGRAIYIEDNPDLTEKLKTIKSLPIGIQKEVYHGLLKNKGLIAETPGTSEVTCQCKKNNRIEGREAYDYIESHLKLLGTTRDGEVYHYICPHTKKRWVYKSEILETRRLKKK
ncbi:MAG: DUF6498-containing protein [Planctomycetota bacterium]|jgi:hypothetical protein